jgi:hypothetical protein
LASNIRTAESFTPSSSSTRILALGSDNVIGLLPSSFRRALAPAVML